MQPATTRTDTRAVRHLHAHTATLLLLPCTHTLVHLLTCTVASPRSSRAGRPVPGSPHADTETRAGPGPHSHTGTSPLMHRRAPAGTATDLRMLPCANTTSALHTCSDAPCRPRTQHVPGTYRTRAAGAHAPSYKHARPGTPRTRSRRRARWFHALTRSYISP